jgi:WD40 repeat protein
MKSIMPMSKGAASGAIKWKSPIVICGATTGLIGMLFLVSPLQRVGDKIEDVVVSADGKYVAQSNGFGAVVVDVESAKTLQQIKEAAASRLVLSPDCKFLAYSTLTSLTLWDLKKDVRIGSWEGSSRASFKVCFSSDGALIAACDDKSLRVWDVAVHKLVLSVPLSFEHDSVALSSNGKMVAVGGAESKEKEPRTHHISMWSIATGELFGELKGLEYCVVKSLAFSPDDQYLATGLSTLTCRLWDLGKKKELWKQSVESVDYGMAGFTKDGTRLVVGGYQTMSILDVAKGDMLKTFRFQGTIASVATKSNDGLIFVAEKSAADKSSVYAVDLTSGSKEKVFPK